MSYLDDVEKDFRDALPKGVDHEECTSLCVDCVNSLVSFVREKVLESFKNGAQAARKQMGKTPTPKQKSQTGNHSKA